MYNYAETNGKKKRKIVHSIYKMDKEEYVNHMITKSNKQVSVLSLIKLFGKEEVSDILRKIYDLRISESEENIRKAREKAGKGVPPKINHASDEIIALAAGVITGVCDCSYAYKILVKNGIIEPRVSHLKYKNNRDTKVFSIVNKIREAHKDRFLSAIKTILKGE